MLQRRAWARNSRRYTSLTSEEATPGFPGQRSSSEEPIVWRKAQSQAGILAA